MLSALVNKENQAFLKMQKPWPGCPAPLSLASGAPDSAILEQNHITEHITLRMMSLLKIQAYQESPFSNH